MENTLWILVYSQYSAACNDFFALYQNYRIPLQLIPLQLKLLQIDHKDIRQRVLQDKRFNIQVVPCLISLTQSGVASQYEGEKAFAILHSFIHSLVPPRPSPPSSPPPSQLVIQSENKESISPPTLSPSSSPTMDSKITPIEELIDEPNNVVTGTLKGEKISASSVMAQAQQQQSSDVHPRIPPQKQTEDPPVQKSTGGKVNISAIMASSRN